MIYVAILILAFALVVLAFIVVFGIVFFYSENSYIYSSRRARWTESTEDAGRYVGGFAMAIAGVVAFVFILSIFVPFS